MTGHVSITAPYGKDPLAVNPILAAFRLERMHRNTDGAEAARDAAAWLVTIRARANAMNTDIAFGRRKGGYVGPIDCHPAYQGLQERYPGGVGMARPRVNEALNDWLDTVGAGEPSNRAAIEATKAYLAHAAAVLNRFIGLAGGDIAVLKFSNTDRRRLNDAIAVTRTRAFTGDTRRNLMALEELRRLEAIWRRLQP